jgi:hypothetical protein
MEMRETGVLILVLLVVGVMAGCAEEKNGPAEATQETLDGTSEVATTKEATNPGETSTAGTGEAGKPRIAFEEKDFDFGKVEAGEKVEKTYKFRNTGDATLVVHKVRSS